MKKKITFLLLLSTIITSIFCFTLTTNAATSPSAITWNNVQVNANSDYSIVYNLKNKVYSDVYNNQERYTFKDSNGNELHLIYDKNKKLVSYSVYGYYFKFDDGITAGFTPDQVQNVLQGYYGLNKPSITVNDVDKSYTYSFNNKKITYYFSMDRLVYVTVS